MHAYTQCGHCSLHPHILHLGSSNVRDCMTKRGCIRVGCPGFFLVWIWSDGGQALRDLWGRVGLMALGLACQARNRHWQRSNGGCNLCTHEWNTGGGMWTGSCRREAGTCTLALTKRRHGSVPFRAPFPKLCAPAFPLGPGSSICR